MTMVSTQEGIADGFGPRCRARLGAYTLWQLRDYVMNRGVPTTIVMLLLGFLGVGSLFSKVNSDDGPPVQLIDRAGSISGGRLLWRHELSMGFVASVLGSLAFFGALFAMNGVISNDRKLGFYRFLFAKPMAPTKYYGAEFAVNAAGFLLVSALLAVVYGIVVEPVLRPSLLVAIASGYLCYAGLGFALSALSRWDWLSFVAVSGAAQVLWPMYQRSQSPFAILLYLLPPVERTGSIYSAAARGLALPWHSVLWLAGYGTIAFVAGLVILRQRRLAFN